MDEPTTTTLSISESPRFSDKANITVVIFHDTGKRQSDDKLNMGAETSRSYPFNIEGHIWVLYKHTFINEQLIAILDRFDVEHQL